MGLGFGFDETMSGTWTRDGVERPFSFTVNVRKHDRLAEMEGTVDAGFI
jgi:hypothetical protein